MGFSTSIGPQFEQFGRKRCVKSFLYSSKVERTEPLNFSKRFLGLPILFFSWERRLALPAFHLPVDVAMGTISRNSSHRRLVLALTFFHLEISPSEAVIPPC